MPSTFGEGERNTKERAAWHQNQSWNSSQDKFTCWGGRRPMHIPPFCSHTPSHHDDHRSYVCSYRKYNTYKLLQYKVPPKRCLEGRPTHKCGLHSICQDKAGHKINLCRVSQHSALHGESKCHRTEWDSLACAHWGGERRDAATAATGAQPRAMRAESLSPITLRRRGPCLSLSRTKHSVYLSSCEGPSLQAGRTVHSAYGEGHPMACIP